jgi:hypothetical protein
MTYTRVKANPQTERIEIQPLPPDAALSIYHSKKEKYRLVRNGHTLCAGTLAECAFIKLRLVRS